jgi:hypothetical protein
VEAGEGRGVGSGDCDEAESSRGPVCVLALEERVDQERVRRLGGDARIFAHHDLRCAVHLEMLKLPVSSSRIDTPSSQTSQITRPDSYSFSRMEAGRSLSFIEEAAEWLPRWFGRRGTVLGMILRHTVSIFRRMEGARLLKPGKRASTMEVPKRGKGDGHCGRAVPLVRASWPGAEKGVKQCMEGERGEYKAHELTTISGCVMMGMGGEQRERKPNLNELHML